MAIEDLKKKTKLSLDEMHDNQVVGNPEIRTEVREDVKTVEKNEENKNYHFPSYSDGKIKEKMDCKLTFNVNVDTFKAFNEIYAERMLYDEKTEKSVLICEAIRLLYEREKEKRKRKK